MFLVFISGIHILAIVPHAYLSSLIQLITTEVKRKANNRNRYNQVPHLTPDALCDLSSGWLSRLIESLRGFYSIFYFTSYFLSNNFSAYQVFPRPNKLFGVGSLCLSHVIYSAISYQNNDRNAMGDWSFCNFSRLV